MKNLINVFSVTAILLLAHVQEIRAFVGGEHWNEEAAATITEPTGTLPVIYINTDNGAVIDQKETYLPGSYWLDARGMDNVENIGSADNMLPLQIRGRGNTTFYGFDKKPYKLKLDSKQSLLGMGKNKHWGLLHFIGDNTAYFGEPLFRYLGKKIMKCWTPSVRPVEVVLNGRYIGLYFLCETVRIDTNRLDINEQPEDNTDPELMDDGWLIEIDNNPSDNYITINEIDYFNIDFTPDTPDPMNDVQRLWLTEHMQKVNAAIYNPDKFSRDVEQYLDFDALARHYVIQEIMTNSDAYCGSAYLYKETGQPWKFGPLWDAGNGLYADKFCLLHENTPQHWIGEIYKYPRFVKAVQEVWLEVQQIDVDDVHAMFDRWYESISVAEAQNQKIWLYYVDNPLENRLNYAKSCFSEHYDWLDNLWGRGPLTHTVTFDPSFNGTILVNGKQYDEIEVFVNSDLTISFVPDKDYELGNINIQGVNSSINADITSNTLTIHGISSDTQIAVSYCDASNVNDIVADSCGDVIYHTLDGMRIDAPVPNQPVVVSRRNADGATSSRIVIIRN